MPKFPPQDQPVRRRRGRPVRRRLLFGEPSSQELLQVTLIDCFDQKLGSLLVAPGVVNDEFPLPRAEVEVGVVDIPGPGNGVALIGGKFWVGDELVGWGCPQDGIVF